MFFIVKIAMLRDEIRGIDVSAPQSAHRTEFQQVYDRKSSENVGQYIKWKIMVWEIIESASCRHDFLLRPTRKQMTDKERKKERTYGSIVITDARKKA